MPGRVSGARQYHNLALVGFMGTGKTSVGRLVARQLRFDFVDTDDLIVAQAGQPITEIFARSGEAAFRQLEFQVVQSLVGRERLVIATGGGLVTNPENLASLRSHALIICLWAGAEAIWQRTHRMSHRPLLRDADPRTRIQELLAAREAQYRQADIIINTEHRSVHGVAQHVLNHFRQSHAISD